MLLQSKTSLHPTGEPSHGCHLRRSIAMFGLKQALMIGLHFEMRQVHCHMNKKIHNTLKMEQARG